MDISGNKNNRHPSFGVFAEVPIHNAHYEGIPIHSDPRATQYQAMTTSRSEESTPNSAPIDLPAGAPSRYLSPRLHVYSSSQLTDQATTRRVQPAAERRVRKEIAQKHMQVPETLLWGTTPANLSPKSNQNIDSSTPPIAESAMGSIERAFRARNKEIVEAQREDRRLYAKIAASNGIDKLDAVPRENKGHIMGKSEKPKDINENSETSDEALRAPWPSPILDPPKDRHGIHNLEDYDLEARQDPRTKRIQQGTADVLEEIGLCRIEGSETFPNNPFQMSARQFQDMQRNRDMQYYATYQQNLERPQQQQTAAVTSHPGRGHSQAPSQHQQASARDTVEQAGRLTRPSPIEIKNLLNEECKTMKPSPQVVSSQMGSKSVKKPDATSLPIHLAYQYRSQDRSPLFVGDQPKKMYELSEERLWPKTTMPSRYGPPDLFHGPIDGPGYQFQTGVLSIRPIENPFVGVATLKMRENLQGKLRDAEERGEKKLIDELRASHRVHSKASSHVGPSTFTTGQQPLQVLPPQDFASCINQFIGNSAPGTEAHTGSFVTSTRIQIQDQLNPDPQQEWQVPLMVSDGQQQNTSYDAARHMSSLSRGNDALQEYQMQLMLLEQQNRNRLITARSNQSTGSPRMSPSPPRMPPTSNTSPGPVLYLTGSRPAPTSSNLKRLKLGKPATVESYSEKVDSPKLNAFVKAVSDRSIPKIELPPPALKYPEAFQTSSTSTKRIEQRQPNEDPVILEILHRLREDRQGFEMTNARLRQNAADRKAQVDAQENRQRRLQEESQQLQAAEKALEAPIQARIQNCRDQARRASVRQNSASKPLPDIPDSFENIKLKNEEIADVEGDATEEEDWIVV